ncbi:ribbon-helix-helix protein, CopG family [Planktothrix agardhii]|uniref:ribbon-helix-helix protein, CopG family n=1 Tax=Planktothrix agardhii TaxID=1160 RepID=UPI0039B1077D
MAPRKKPVELLNVVNLSIKVPKSLDRAIEIAARNQRITKSELIRNSLINLDLPETEKTA